jgi:RND family efflux transporter MFP subunit
MIKRAILAVSAAALFAGAGCSKGAEQKPSAPPPREVEVLTIAPGDVRETGEYLGTMTSRTSVNLLPQIAGYVRKIDVKPGQQVKSGQVLVEVDSRQEAAALQSAQAQHRSAATGHALAVKNLERTRALMKEGLSTAQELERAQAGVDAAEAAKQATAAQIAQSRVELGFHAVRAPLTGTVGDVLVRLGDYVTASTPLTTITQGDMLEVDITVPAERARAVKVGTPVEVLDSSNKVLVSTSLYFVAPQADQRTQLVDVKAMVPNNVGLRPNEMLRTRIVFGSRKALQVPALAVVRQSGQPFVFAVQQGPNGPTVARRPITLGALGERNYVVEKGLATGDVIAVSSLQALRDGAKVLPKPAVMALEPPAKDAAPPPSL